MLIPRATLEGIVEGSVTLAFRRWKRPTVLTGGTLRTALGVLAIDRVEPIGEGDIGAADARKAGFRDRAELLRTLRRRGEGELYRIELRWAGPDPRAALRRRSRLGAEEVAELERSLARFDAASRQGPWTRTTLSLIEEKPGRRAAELAASAGWPQAWFKGNVRKLKELGLTESLEVGYRLSPRGRAFLRAG